MTTRLKYLADINQRSLSEDTDPEYIFRYIDIGAVGRGILVTEPEPTNFAAAPSRARRLVSTGDTIISTVRTYLRAVWPVTGPSDDLVVSTGFAVLSPRSQLDSRYLAWLAQSDLVVEEVVARSVGVSYPAINASEIGDIAVPTPPIEDQRAIADYLDRETARIDALVAAKRRLGQLLEERWVNVRRYLTWSDESSKPSSLVQLRRIARLQAGSAFPHQYQGDTDGVIPYVKVGDLSNVDERDQICGAANHVTPEVAATLHSPILPSGTIVLPKIGVALLMNKRAILSEPSCLDQNVMGVMVQTGNPRFVYHCLASVDLGELSTPGPVPLLNEETALSVRIPWSSSEEQDKVVAALDANKDSIAAPRALLTRQVALLQEHRQALITAAVVGELEIPGAAA